jgi:outer membrane protein
MIMTNKIFLSLSILILLTTSTVFSQNATQSAIQNITVASVNTTELLNAFPQRIAATQRLLQLSENYKKELELMQNQYNRLFSDFITHQVSLAENIKLRRMQELTELESRIRQFMELAQQDIENQEQIMLLPLKQSINSAIQAIGTERGFTVIYDLADPGIAFVTPNAVDINPIVRQRLGIN